MKFFKSLAVAVCLFATSALAQEGDDALRDLQIGMEGLREATKNPALLAQLMKDLQDPEMMAEAKKMMDDPNFQKEMKKLSETKDFKESVKKSVDAMKDPSTAARMEAQMEHMVKVGNEKIKTGATAAMEEAMASMANPEVMAEMASMMKDPKFQQQIAGMVKDPSFKNYVSAMEDMMKDPEKKKKVEKISESFRNSV
uniref:STI1 domain-containing protein n=1 Tax=Grammatophora oceanica TaxID=210454 RepID=A0A7S1UP72_9STRA|mmetsp:Transcript_14680/g.21606  ORF Transcript_14680/g.21606 Transcript_14680/m.21606 type:complete len:198 (+) Transcript_14680:91-684(+)|eukprot:CAMPEP_0194046002 /NCGR_PEP_ID=MMETSP0009_2-20130614/19115_1 /TAXON_ID=210454 /ORGANISM="Grammatophora oceanica, Strain CCMP 410" /LENGTH=197 /DNA_ID=CAMNT_0038691099 /DNA_START=91 /DNA_END=684 /DNA_ORIENTATION=-